MKPFLGGSKNYPWRVVIPANLAPRGKRSNKTFKTKPQAEEFCRGYQRRHMTLGAAMAGLNDESKHRIAALLESVSGDVGLVERAVALYRRTERLSDKTLRELWPVFVKAKKAEGVSPAHIYDITYRLRRFADYLGPKPLREVGRAEVIGWMDEPNVEDGGAPSHHQRKNNRKAASTFFAWAFERSMTSSNPAAGIRMPRQRGRKPVGILTPEALAPLLHESKGWMRYYLAIAFFAGLRTKEIRTLGFENLDWQANEILVPPHLEKNVRGKNLPMNPTLMAWLKSEKDLPLSGPIIPLSDKNFRLARNKILQKTKIVWPNNCARHSFATHTYSLEGLHRTCTLLGDTSMDMVNSRYVALANRETAQRYFSLRPRPSH